ncbi:hypothetical protein [Paenibacillus nasutitermitis]|uniref:Spore coat protein n=1 Tax=Paenibacillus nasutitermitis TaxID=1652958 RepID=A0A917DL21_9BACL|nr:hypothetical protein [Paenibacillus nasutitermitis]GGD49027.1 hypothetical protein GCM10010911_03210 [Paenibacillus nasutitermitis]
MMQPISSKEMEYIVDSISNEDLLMKQCAAVAFTAQNQGIKQVCSHMISTHHQHTQTLMNALQQHQQLAPTQPQN